MYKRFGYPGLFAAYNAGLARYAAYLAGGAHLPRETIGYGRGEAVSESAAGPVYVVLRCWSGVR